MGVNAKPDICSAVHTQSWADFIGDDMLVEKNLGIRVNFDQRLMEILAEAELLDKFGFKLENKIRAFTEMKDSTYGKVDALNKMVKEYRAVINGLDQPQVNGLVFVARTTLTNI